MRRSEEIEQLRSELQQDLHFIRRNYKKNREMTERIRLSAEDDEYQYAALGYTIHNIYNAFESYFLRIAKFFERSQKEHLNVMRPRLSDGASGIHFDLVLFCGGSRRTRLFDRY